MAHALQGQAGTSALEFWVGEPERLAKRFPLNPGTCFSLEHRNSIYEAPVRETFCFYPPRGLVLTRVESPSAGVFEYYGLEADEKGACRLFRPLASIRLRSMDYAHHRLFIGDRVISLAGWVKSGQRLVLKMALAKKDGLKNKRNK
jgi:hypothetical protein